MALKSSASEPISNVSTTTSTTTNQHTSLLRVLDRSSKAKGYLLNALHRSFSTPSIESSTMAEEDPSTMTIEFLRARLQLQRAEYRAEKRRAQALAQKVVELEKKVSKMEIQLRKRGEDGKAKAGIPCMGGVDNEAVTEIGVALNEAPQLEQYQNDIAHRKVSVSSFGGSEVSGNDNEYRRNEPCSFSSPESYSPCRHSSCVRRHCIQEFQNSSRVKKSPLRCLEKKDKLPVSINNDSNGSHQTAQWLLDTTSEVRGQWADHDSHDFVPNLKSGNHEIIAEEEMDEQMLPLCRFCQFPNHTQYQGDCNFPSSNNHVGQSLKSGTKYHLRKSGREKPNHARNEFNREISCKRKLQSPFLYMSSSPISTSSLDKYPCSTALGRTLRSLGCEKSRSYLDNIGIGKQEKIHPIANPILNCEVVKNEKEVDCEVNLTKETTPVLVNNPLFDTLEPSEIANLVEKNGQIRGQECVVEAKDRQTGQFSSVHQRVINKPRLPTKQILKVLELIKKSVEDADAPTVITPNPKSFKL